MNPLPRVAHPPEWPLLVFDGDCAFCRRWIARWKQVTEERVEYAPLQSDELAARFPELPREQLESAVQLIEPDGRVTRAAEALFRSLAVTRRGPLWLYEYLPGVAPFAELAYRMVAAKRTIFSAVTRCL